MLMEAKDAFYQRKNLQERIANNAREIDNLKAEHRDFLDQNWWFPLAGRISSDLGRVGDEIAAARDSDRKRTQVELRIADLRKQRGTGFPYCGQAMPADSLEKTDHAIAVFQGEIEAPSNVEDLGSLQVRLQAMSRFSTAAAIESQIRQQSEEITRKSLEAHRLGLEIETLNEVLEGISTDVAAIESELRGARESHASANNELEFVRPRPDHAPRQAHRNALEARKRHRSKPLACGERARLPRRRQGEPSLAGPVPIADARRGRGANLGRSSVT